MNRLTEILAAKREEIQPLLAQRAALRSEALRRNPSRSFAAALRGGGGRTLSLIAEVKRASPSAGLIAENFDPVEIAMKYEAGGANAISVLTDARFFQGHLDHLKAVRESVQLPVLRKDFVLDEVQIYEAAVAGADAVLLIVAALEDEQLARLHNAATSCQLDVLVEVHTLAELDRALGIDAQIIGINNRDLATFNVDLAVTETLSEEVPAGVLLVSESGLRSVEDCHRARASGADAILVGEALMRSHDVPTQIREMKLEGSFQPDGVRWVTGVTIDPTGLKTTAVRSHFQDGIFSSHELCSSLSGWILIATSGCSRAA